MPQRLHVEYMFTCKDIVQPVIKKSHCFCLQKRTMTGKNEIPWPLITVLHEWNNDALAVLNLSPVKLN